NSGETAGSPDGNNIVFGDQGYIDYVSTDGDARDIDTVSSGDLVPFTAPGFTGTADTLSAANSVDINTGGNDAITTGAGNDIILGGPGADTIASGDGQGVVFGDSGQITSAVGYDAGAPFGAHPFQLGTILSIQSSADGNDKITDGAGSD